MINEKETEVIESEPQEFSIVPVQDKDTKVYSIQHFDALYKRIENWCIENSPIGKIITDDDFKYYVGAKLKKPENGEKNSIRVIASEMRELVSNVRKGVIQATMGVFEQQAKSIERLLDKFDSECKAEKVAYMDKHINVAKKPTINKLEIKSYDSKVIEKVRAYALKLGCEVK